MQCMAGGEGGSRPHKPETRVAPAGEEPERGCKEPPAPPPHSESSSGCGMEGQCSGSTSRPCVQSVHIFLQGLQAGIYFGHVCCLVVGAVLFHRDPAPRIGQASLMAAAFHRGGLLRVGPAPGGGAGRLPAAANADRRECSGTSGRSLGHLPPRPPRWFQGSRLHHPTSLQKTVSSLPRHLGGGGPFPAPKFYPLGRESEKSSNSLQEPADEQRLRKLSTRGGRRE